ncbi:MAG: lipid A biosynthesis acyltransferase [Bacteroidia bacterium]
MPSWQGKSKGTPLGYRIFVVVLKTLGVRPAYYLLWFVSFYYLLFSRDSNHAILEVYRKHLKFGVLRSRFLLWKNYRLFGQSMIDKIVMMSGVRNRFTFEFEGEDYLHEMVKAGKGGMLISAHLGNWEIAGFLLKRIPAAINIVMYDAEHEKIKNYLEGVTGKRNMNVILVKEDLSHIYAISAALSRNELVCMHADRFLDGNRNLVHTFMGEAAAFPQGPFLLASRLDVPVTFVFAVKESAMHYHFSATKPVNYHLTDRKAGMMQALSKYVDVLEKQLRRYPAQWFNYYPFWKH